MLKVEERAFLAGMAAQQMASQGIDSNGIDIVESVERMEQMGRQAAPDSLFGPAWNSIKLRMSGYFAAEEANRDAKLALSGVDLSKKMSMWGGNEWQQAVVSMAMYRFWLQREISCVTDFLTCDFVRKSDELSATADEAANVARNHFKENDIPMIDPAWAGKFIRRIHQDAMARNQAP